MNTLLLDALKCENDWRRPPVWLMRQAGRYMPQYRALRTKHTLWDMFHQPELAAEVTLMPIDILGVDAAILFSDILVIAEALGLTAHYPEKGGPFLSSLLMSIDEIDRLQLLEVETVLDYVKQTILLLKPELSVPLIGFCGGPFTVAAYILDGAQKGEFKRTLSLIESNPASLHLLLEKLTNASIEYLRLQIEAGVEAVQIFDSWANIVHGTPFQEFALSYAKKIIDALNDSSIPIIYFCRDSSSHVSEVAAIGPSAISFDWNRPMVDLRQATPSHIAVQGNIDPEILKKDHATIVQSVENVLKQMSHEKGFVLNLGHGVLPDTPVDHVRCFVDTVKNFATTAP